MTVEIDIDFDKLYDFLESAKRAEGIVHYSVPYALYVEVDTSYDDKKPPLDPILEWVKRNIQTDDPKSVAFAIQNKIYKKGTKGVYFLTNEKNKMKTEWENIAEQYKDSNDENAPEKIVEEMLDTMLEGANDTIRNEAYDTGNLQNSGVVMMHVDPNSNTMENETINIDESNRS